MLTPATADLTAYIGGTFDPVIELWEDDAQTVPFDLSGYAVSFVIQSRFELTEGDGVTVTGGQVQVSLTAEQTAAEPRAGFLWWLAIEQGGDVVFPVAGNLRFEYP